MPYPVESVGQDVHQEPPDELVRLERHGFVAAGSLDPKVMSAIESCRTVTRSDHQFARPIGDRLHGFNAVHHEVDDYLLQLDPKPRWTPTSPSRSGENT